MAELQNNELNFFEKINEKKPYYVYVHKLGDEKRKEDIKDFFDLDIIKQFFLQPVDTKYDFELSIMNIFDLIEEAFIIVIESVYIDKLYRDTYYNFYSEKLNNIDRNCIRISFFKITNEFPEISKEIGIFYEQKYHDILQQSIIGTVVIRPLIHHPIGRIILDPFKLKIKKCFLRLTETEVTILGQIYKLKFYPFSGQDEEFMSCAETSLWTIFEYYGQRYPEYRTVVPSEFIETLDDINIERTLPSKGLPYTYKAKILKQFGFYPLVYTREIIKKQFSFGERNYKNIFHCYVESGIPIAMTLVGKERTDRHAVICMGHGELNYSDFENKIYIYSDPNKKVNIKFIDSSEFVDTYAVIDDSMIPYKLDTFDKFSLKLWQLQMFIAPLYKKIFVDAVEALIYFNHILEVCSKEINEYINKCDLKENEKIVVKRCFLTSSRKYSAFRTMNSENDVEKFFYASLPFAKFLWVMELGILSEYKDNKRVFAEFVLDATSSGIEFYESAILFRVGSRVGYKLFDETPFDDTAYEHISDEENSYNSYKIVNRFISGGSCEYFTDDFRMYENNLIEVN